jgi:hypothetical protein
MASAAAKRRYSSAATRGNIDENLQKIMVMTLEGQPAATQSGKVLSFQAENVPGPAANTGSVMVLAEGAPNYISAFQRVVARPEFADKGWVIPGAGRAWGTPKSNVRGAALRAGLSEADAETAALMLEVEALRTPAPANARRMMARERLLAGMMRAVAMVDKRWQLTMPDVAARHAAILDFIMLSGVRRTLAEGYPGDNAMIVGRADADLAAEALGYRDLKKNELVGAAYRRLEARVRRQGGGTRSRQRASKNRTYRKTSRRQ